MRDAMHTLGGNPQKINPICPVDLVVDHSIQVDFNRRWLLSLMRQFMSIQCWYFCDRLIFVCVDGHYAHSL